jgi:hypothetical protein
MRVFLSSLRCFFFAMRLRRFLMTEPTVHLSGNGTRLRDRLSLPGLARTLADRSTGLKVRLAQVVVDRVLWDAERAPHANGGQISAMYEPIDGHL